MLIRAVRVIKADSGLAGAISTLAFAFVTWFGHAAFILALVIRVTVGINQTCWRGLTQASFALLLRTFPLTAGTNPQGQFGHHQAGLARTVGVTRANRRNSLAHIAVAHVKQAAVTVKVAFRWLTRAPLADEGRRAGRLVAVGL